MYILYIYYIYIIIYTYTQSLMVTSGHFKPKPSLHPCTHIISRLPSLYLVIAATISSQVSGQQNTLILMRRLLKGSRTRGLIDRVPWHS